MRGGDARRRLGAARPATTGPASLLEAATAVDYVRSVQRDARRTTGRTVRRSVRRDCIHHPAEPSRRSQHPDDRAQTVIVGLGAVGMTFVIIMAASSSSVGDRVVVGRHRSGRDTAGTAALSEPRRCARSGDQRHAHQPPSRRCRSSSLGTMDRPRVGEAYPAGEQKIDAGRVARRRDTSRGAGWVLCPWIHGWPSVHGLRAPVGGRRS